MKAVRIQARDAAADFDKLLTGKPFQKDRAMLQSLRPRILKAYERYRTRSPELASFKSSFTDSRHKSALRSCYANSSSTKEKIRTAAIAAADWCPYCDVSAPSDCDHYLPRKTHPELSIFYRNLIPSCSTCNSPRSPIDKKKRRQKLHMYDDDIEKIDSMLAVKISNDSRKLIFYLKKSRATTMNALYRRHFKAMNLAERFAKAAGNSLATVVANVRAARAQGQSDLTISKVGLSAAAADEKNLGKNHWRVAVHKAAYRLSYVRSIP